ncbi:PAS domain S-box protein [Levilinea saccharolytica]|uniref:Protein containing PAS domain S-box n=1 Tax=Levilinea saccharolytica TaxID=229921 RepID=A0A0M9U2X9_9CHLR|nr:PAS domain S-box protein [Levilinea saccharolytica]GAP19183.1 protein containing PAS domain S-box [Levilinea saccharolytica]
MKRRAWPLAVLLGMLVGALALSSLPVREAQAGWQITPTPTSGRRTLRIGGDWNYPPYSYTTGDQPQGLDMEMARAVGEALNVNVEIWQGSWGDVRRWLEEGSIDAVAGMAYSDEREKIYDFSTPYAYLSFDLFVPQASELKGMEDLRDKAVVVQRGGVMEEYLVRSGLAEQVILVENAPDALTLLAAGRYDAALLNEAQGHYFLQKNPNWRLKALGVDSPQTVRYGFAVREGNQDVLNLLNQGLNLVKREGVYDRILENWTQLYQPRTFGQALRTWPYLRVALFGLGGLLLFTVLSLVWGATLRREVRARTQALKQSEEKYRLLVETASEAVLVSTRDGRILFANAASELISGYSLADLLQLRLDQVVHLEDYEMIRTAVSQVLLREKKTLEAVRILTREGNIRFVHIQAAPIDWQGEQAVLSLVTDVTERVQVEERLRDSERRYRTIFQKTPVGIFQYDRDLRITRLNQRFADILQAPPKRLIRMNMGELKDQRVIPALRAALEGREGFYEGEYQTTQSGVQIFVWMRTAPFLNDQGEAVGGIGMVEDISVRVKIEQALRDSEEKFSKAFRTTPDSISINRMSDGVFLEVNDGFTRVTGYEPQEALGKSVMDLGLWVSAEDEKLLTSRLRESGEVLDFEASMRVKGGALRIGQVSSRTVELNGERCVLTILRDVTEQKRTQARLQQQYQQIAALRDVDLTITARIDLQEVLRTVLEHITLQTHAEAADILLMNPETQQLTYAAGRGFFTNSVQHVRYALGEGYAGLAAQNQHTVVISRLSEVPPSFFGGIDLAAERFTGYLAFPLLVEGQVQGVLEVYQRSTPDLELEHVSFIESMVNQAAIAIDNAALFRKLTQAYDATIAGWARALELRDYETEGHSERVTEWVVELAQRMGMNGENLAHVRRGALLHDIGKMGIPDQVLLKPGPLTDEEWVIMRQHPMHAYYMLADIDFLRPALDIPYGHHERWDGSGYPRGLRGEEIPLAARIFAVVDVWDALHSSRPYRPQPWEPERIAAYLHEESGRLFDPQVVIEFLAYLREQGELPSGG